MKAVKIVLAEDPGSVPKTVLGSSQPPVTPVSEAPISSSGLLGYMQKCGSHKFTQGHKSTHNLN